MATRRGSERRALEANLNIRLSNTTYDLLANAASGAGLDRAGYVRGLIATALGREPDRLPRRCVSADIQTLSLLAGNVARANGAIVQLAKAVRETGYSPSLHAEAEKTLADLRALQVRTLAILREP